jgi:hypothetical protein
VGDVAEETLLAAHVTGEPRGHVVYRGGKGAQFIAPVDRQARVELAARDLLGGLAQAGQAAGDSSHENEPPKRGENQRARARPQPGADIEQQAAQARGGRGDDQCQRRPDRAFKRARWQTHQQPVTPGLFGLDNLLGKVVRGREGRSRRAAIVAGGWSAGRIIPVLWRAGPAVVTRTRPVVL